MELVTVFETMSPAEASMVRQRLEAAGFHAEIMGESALNVLYPGVLGKAEVKVLAEEAQDARELLEAEQ